MLDGKACSITGNAFYQRSSFFVSLAFCDVIRIDVLDIDSRIGKDWFLFFSVCACCTALSGDTGAVAAHTIDPNAIIDVRKRVST